MDSQMDAEWGSPTTAKEESKGEAPAQPGLMESIRLDYPTLAATISQSAASRPSLDSYVEIGTPIPGSHVLYPIAVGITQGRDKRGDFSCKRRYNDFFALHRYLLLRWPGIPIPQIPPKKLIVTSSQGNKSEEVIRFRRDMLQAFLKVVMQMPFVSERDEFSTFLRTEGSFKSASDAFKRFTIVELSEEYTSIFPEHAHKSVTPAIESSLELDFQGLSRLMSDFRQCSQVSANLSRSFGLLQTTYGRFSESMLEFEEQNMGELKSGLPAPGFRRWSSEGRQNPFEILSTWFLVEGFQVQSMLEVYEGRRKLQNFKSQLEAKKLKNEMTANKLRSGQNTFRGFISGKSKPAQIGALEVQIKDGEETIRALTSLYDLITVRLHDFELVTFKRQKADMYEGTMRRFGKAAAEEYSTVSNRQMVQTVTEMKAGLPELDGAE